MLSAPGLTTQASPISARTHTRPMRPPLTATRMESLPHPDLHRFLGSLGSLSLVWPLLSLRSYDRLVPSFVASDYVKGAHCWLPVVTQFVTYLIAICWTPVFSSQSSCLIHDCGAVARLDSFLRFKCSLTFCSYVSILAIELRSCAGSQTTLPYLRNWLQFPSPFHICLCYRVSSYYMAY